jgi:hypothetical protein
MKYELKTKGKAIFDGQTVAAGVVVGTIETNLPIDNVLSSLAFSSLSVEATESESQIVSRSNVGADAVHDSKPSDLQSADGKSDPEDPDEINRQEAIKEAAELVAAEAAKARKAVDDSKSAKTAEVKEIDASFAGLDVRLATAITSDPSAGIKTRADLDAWIRAGKDLIDLDGVGKKTKPKIIAWLEATKPESQPE